VRLRLSARSPIPRSLESVTTINAAAEVDPAAVGVEPEARDRVWSAVERLYRCGLHPAIQLCIRRRGQVLLDRAIGHARGNGPEDPPESEQVLATPATPFNTLSASKAVTAMLVHLLDHRNLIRLDDPVCEYIPEFAVHQKQWITIRHVLTHRAGVPNIPPHALDLDRLGDRDFIVRAFCETKPIWRPGRQLAYHAVIGGFILGEIIERVTGKNPRTLLDEEIRRPLGFRWMSYGVAPEDVDRVAVNAFTGPPPFPPISTLLTRALGAGFREVTAMSNDARFLTAVIPSANLIATANELSRFFQLLLAGGELDGVRIFEPRTIRRATAEQSYLEFDLTIGLPLRYGLGFMLGSKWFSPFGSDTQYAFGHLGFTNIVCWADSQRDTAVSIMTSGKPVVYPELYFAFDVLRQIGLACPKDNPEPWRTALSVPRRIE
jgi:CubicO group peptidase (beta-lactamase class C family)